MFVEKFKISDKQLVVMLKNNLMEMIQGKKYGKKQFTINDKEKKSISCLSHYAANNKNYREGGNYA